VKRREKEPPSGGVREAEGIKRSRLAGPGANWQTLRVNRPHGGAEHGGGSVGAGKLAGRA